MREVAGPWRPLGEGEGAPSYPHRTGPPCTRTPLHLGSCEGLQGGAKWGSALGVLQEEACWGLSFPAPGYSPPPDSGFCRELFGTPTLGLGVSHAPHLLARGPGRPRLLIPGPCSGDFASLRRRPGSWGCCAPQRAVAGAGSAGLQAAGRGGRGGRGRAGRGAPTRLLFLSPSLETRRAEGDARASSLLLHAAVRPHSCVHPFIHTFRLHSTFLPPAIPHARIQSAPTVCRRPCLGSLGESQCRRKPSSTSPGCLP